MVKQKFFLALRRLDRLLRGESSRSTPSINGLLRAILWLGAFYGLCMGMFATVRGSGAQILASAIKLPMLFLLTLLVTFPSLYVFSALSRSQLRFQSTLLLLLRAITVTVVLLASFGPITVFFTFSTASYPFMVLLNVALLAAAGIAGVKYLIEAMGALFAEPARDQSSRIFRVWIYIYGAVGAQMGWVLRPFIGSPQMPFEWFRDRESNFFLGVMEAVRQLFT